jgi:hypothetical protein
MAEERKDLTIVALSDRGINGSDLEHFLCHRPDGYLVARLPTSTRNSRSCLPSFDDKSANKVAGLFSPVAVAASSWPNDRSPFGF